MEKGKIYNYYKELPNWGKGLVAVPIVAIVGFVGYKIYKKLNPSQAEKKAKQLLSSVTNDIIEFKKRGVPQTYPDANYVTFANSIYEGMRYVIGDDYNQVVDTCKQLKTNLDAALTIAAFGTKQNYAFGLVPLGDPMDMLTFIQTELGNEWWYDNKVKQINDYWNSKGITYRV